MGKLSKKAVAVGVSLTTAAWLSGATLLVPLAGAQTVAELQAQIQALLAQVAQLQAQLATLGGAPAAKCSFTRSLTVGSTGDDVKCLQQYLNSTSYKVATSGAGSPGNETTYFGSRTKAAVAAWQAGNGVSPAAGYFGPISRAKYDSLVAAGPTPPTQVTPSTGVEGALTVKLDPGTPDLQEIKEGESNKRIYAIEVKATNNNVTINRVDFNFNARPWLSINGLSLWDGSTKVWEDTNLTSSDFDEITSGSDYKLRAAGLSVLVAKDERKVLELRANAPTKMDTATNINITLNANAVRGTDPVGKTQDAPGAALAVRTFRALSKDVGQLEFSLASENPKNRMVQVSDTATTEIPTLVLNVKAKTQDVTLKTIKFRHLSFTRAIASTTDVLKLYDGSTLLGTATPDAQNGTSTIENLNYKITKDTTKTLTVKAVVKKQVDGNYLEGERISTTFQTLNPSISAEDANFQSATISGETNAQLGGNPLHLFQKYADFSLISASITPKQTVGSNTTRTDKAEGKIRLSVKAVGGDIYLLNDHATLASSGLRGSSTTLSGGASSSTVAAVADSVNSGGTTAELKTKAWLIPSGQTKAFETTVQMNTGQNGTAGFFQAYVDRAIWSLTDSDVTTPGNATTTVAGMHGFAISTANPGDYITPKAFLEAGFNP